MTDDTEFLKEVIETFLGEAVEHLAEFEQLLLEAEEKGDGQRHVVQLFRISHSLKGSAALLGFSKIEGVMHSAESALGRVRDEDAVFDLELVDALMGCCDASRLLVTCIQTNGEEGELDVSSVAARLGASQETLERLSARPGGSPSERPIEILPPSPSHSVEPRSSAASEGEPTEGEPTEGEPARQEEAGQPQKARGVQARVDESGNADEPKAGQASLTRTEGASAEEKDLAAPGFERPVTLDDKVRVKTKVLDRMMNLVGELVLVRNQITQQMASLGASESDQLSGMSQRLSHITSELQESVMTTRMQPIETLWLRFPRMVRELSRSAKKEVRLSTHGSETELDKTIIEQLYDPLNHLIRNAIDHGIESAQQRVQAGKPRVGRVELRAFHEGGLIHVEMGDDGAGLDLARVRARAVEAGLVAPGAIDALSESDVKELIFRAGFSTRDEVGILSGRGVGLDVVRANIEKLGGTVSVDSEVGRGTTFRLSIPVTLAIIPALLVRSGGQRFAIPQASLLEVVHLSEERAEKLVTDIEGASTFRLRNELLPLIRLESILRLGQSRGPEALSIVVLESDGCGFGLAVDAILDTEEIVVKALWAPLRAAGCFAGATILGDGSVSLILDAEGLGARARVVGQKGRAAGVSQETDAAAVAAESEPVLVCQTGHGARIALRLADIHRLEEVPINTVEKTGGGEMIQYRGRILPLVHLNHVLEERRKSPREGSLSGVQSDSLDVIVCSLAGREYGIVVDAIVDIMETEIELQWPGAREGVRGSMVIGGRVTEFLDLEFVGRVVRAGAGRPEVGPSGGSFTEETR